MRATRRGSLCFIQIAESKIHRIAVFHKRASHYGSLNVRSVVLAVVVCGLLAKGWHQFRQVGPNGQSSWSHNTDSDAIDRKFETQGALVIPWSPTASNDVHTIEAKILAAVSENLQPIILVNDRSAQRNAKRLLRDAHVPIGAVRIVQIPLDAVWTRHMGPEGFETDDGSRWIDLDHSARTELRWSCWFRSKRSETQP